MIRDERGLGDAAASVAAAVAGDGWRRDSATRTFGGSSLQGRAVNESPTFPSGEFAGRYRIERELGRGATATVYLAYDSSDGRDVALKVLRPELVESHGARQFLKEIRLTADLHHPCIVPLLDSGETNGQLYYVLPHMSEGTLRTRMSRERQMTVESAVAIAKTLAGALAYAHERGVIHRDVKPENILFSGGEAHLADFGIARALERAIGDATTSTGVVRGTPAYMSPEQASGDQQLDHRSDVYALGCVLYEMLAGMPAFSGPTPQSVIAQRIVHGPRPLSVYRPAVPESVEQVIAKAMMLSPADRYQKVTEFSEALGLALLHGETALQRRRVAQRRTIAVGAVAAAVVAAGLLVAAAADIGPFRPAAVSDTTRIVVFPLVGDSGGRSLGAHDAMLYEAFAQWEGITLVEHFQVRDALERSSARDLSALAQIARQLGAGRFVSGSVTSLGDSSQVRAALHDASSARPLHEATERVANTPSATDSTWSTIASALLLRQANRKGLRFPSGTHSLPASQLFNTGRAALDQWDLAGADSLLQAALTFDHSYARAALTLAESRAWRMEPSARWVALARLSLADSTRLSAREVLVGSALLSLGEGAFADACHRYERLRRADTLDFVAWFGLGQCQHLDHVVVRDKRTRSTWRFRSSEHQAVRAFERAFELLPMAHRGLERAGFLPLRILLLANPNTLRPGASAEVDSARFLARAEWSGDSLLLVPWPNRELPDPTAEVSAAARLAASHGQQRFARIVTSWSAALPNSSGVKEGVSVALEMRGDSTAIDTLVAARRLARDDRDRSRLAAREVVLRLKFGALGDVASLRTAVLLADSLLEAPPRDAADAAVRAPIAALRGLCGQTMALERAAAEPDVRMFDRSRALVADERVALATATLGCPGVREAFERVRARVWGGEVRGSNDERRLIESTLLSRAVTLAAPIESVWVDRLAAVRPDFVLDAQKAALVHDTAHVRTLLRPVLQLSEANIVTADAILPPARLLLGLADTAAAQRILDRDLADLRYVAPGVLDASVQTAALVELLALRAELALSRHETSLAQRLASTLGLLWNHADPTSRNRAAHIAALSLTRTSVRNH